MASPGGRRARERPALHALRVDRRAPFNRAHAAAFSCAAMALLFHRALSVLRSPTLLSFCLLLPLAASDVVLALMWALGQAFRWRPVRRREFPERLAGAAGPGGWPALDVFVCTADPDREPPMTAANTALSAMALEYPEGRLSVYVSDDGGSELTLYGLVEAARFARHWLPFCRENRLAVRCPEAFFRSGGGVGSGSFEEVKMMYESMKRRVERAVEGGWVTNVQDFTKEEREAFRKWTAGFKRDEHPPVVQVLLEVGKNVDISGWPMPNLVYVSREKSCTYPHQFKAGALNTLMRVSGIMTNAPFILTLDCDMYCNDPQAPQRALCYLLNSEEVASRLAYVQFSINFQRLDRDDIYGNELKRVFQINPLGMDGVRGPDYFGSGCFFARRSLSGGPPRSPSQVNLTDRFPVNSSISSEEALRNAHQVASCAFEQDTEWGSQMGFRYGSLVEDFFTSYCLQCEGWESVFCNPPRPAFLGDAPITLHDALSQIKRWTVGNMEVMFSKYCPLTFGTRTAPLLTSMCFAYYALWGIWCIPMVTYAFLPQIALLHGVALFPKVSDPWFYMYAYIFLAAYAQDALEFLMAGGTIQRWWNDQRIWMIRGVTCHPFGIIEFLLKRTGISNFGFNITSKVMEDEQSKRYTEGIMDFGVASPFFVSLGTIAIVNLIAFLMGLVKTLREEIIEVMFLQLFLSGFLVVNSWPVYEAMVLRRDGGRMPWKVSIISIFLAGILYYASYFVFNI